MKIKTPKSDDPTTINRSLLSEHFPSTNYQLNNVKQKIQGTF